MAKKKSVKKDKILHSLKDHEVDMLQALNTAVNQAQQEVNKVIYLLVGPENFQNPSLRIDLEDRTITIVRVDNDE